LRLDLHIHTTRYSRDCSVLNPYNMVVRLRDLGLDGGAVTEHHDIWSQLELERLKHEAQAPSLFLISGKEVECEVGHLLIFGFNGAIQPGARATDIIARVHAVGGAVIWAHPLRFGRYDALPDERIVEIARAFDGFEALTPSHTDLENERALALARKHHLTATGGSDAHAGGEIGRCLTRFNRSLFSLTDLAAALRDGACTPEAGRDSDP